MVCTFAGPHGTGFLPRKIVEEASIQDSPNAIHELKLGTRDEIATTKSRSVAPRFRKFLKLFKANVLQIKKAIFKMLYIKNNK